MGRQPADGGGAPHWVCAGAEEVRLHWDDVGDFLVQRGRRILIDPALGVEDRVLRLFLLGPALAVLLHQRGRLVLHGSAVALNGGAVAFLGGPGWGKSTLAAALHERGHAIVTDDVLALDVRADAAWVSPGFPQLKLWPASLAALGQSPKGTRRLRPDLDKRARRIRRGFAAHSLPLNLLYVLADDERTVLSAIEPADAVPELVRHTFGARSLQSIGGPARFLQYAALASRVPMRRLGRPRALGALAALAELVERDAASRSHRRGAG